MKEIEIWKSLDFMGYPDYEVSSFGRVKSLNYRRMGKEKILKLKKNKDGYLYVNLCKNGKQKTYKVHRLVTSAYIPNPLNLPQVNHRNKIKTDNRLENLEWVSPKDNSNYGSHNEKLSKSLKGRIFTEEHKQKLSEANKKTILQFTKEGIFIREWDSITQAEQELNLSHISECCNNKRKTCGKYVWRYKNVI